MEIAPVLPWNSLQLVFKYVLQMKKGNDETLWLGRVGHIALMLPIQMSLVLWTCEGLDYHTIVKTWCNV